MRNIKFTSIFVTLTKHDISHGNEYKFVRYLADMILKYGLDINIRRLDCDWWIAELICCQVNLTDKIADI